MGDDEEATLRTLTEYRGLFSDHVQQYNGRLVDTEGDSVLAEFQSVVDSVRCAVEIQKALKDRNKNLQQHRRMEFRIGINLGDVIEEEDRLYGDGVNIAARIESLADPGGICISGNTHEQIESKLVLEYENLGNHTVKNISRPVQVYRISVESRVMAESSKNKIVSPSEKPTIAVLPFDNMSSDPEQEYFSDGMAEEILNGLAKNPGLVVKARTSSFSSQITDQDAKAIGETLNVTHIIEGSVRKAGNRVRVNAKLIKTDEDAHIWSERYDRELTDIFEVQDEIAAAILKELNIHLLDSDEKQIQTKNIEAYDAYLLGHYHLNCYNWEGGSDSFRKAITLDPDYADAFGALALLYNTLIYFASEPIQVTLPEVRNNIDKALFLNPNQPDALIARVCIRFYVDRDYQDAIDDMTNLLQKYPSNHNVLLNFVWIYLALGQTDSASKIIKHMVELDPLNPRAYQGQGTVFLHTRRLDEARQSFERMEVLGNEATIQLALVAFLDDDAQSIENYLKRGESAWPKPNQWYHIFEAAVSYLKGDHRGVKGRLTPLWNNTGHISWPLKCYMAALEGNLDIALDNYSQALYQPEYSVLLNIHELAFLDKIFPDYRSHPKYLKMLRDVGLDKESVAKLKISPLPF